MDEPSVSPAEAARFLGIPEGEARELARPDRFVPLGVLHIRVGAASLKLARELARAREEVGLLSG